MLFHLHFSAFADADDAILSKYPDNLLYEVTFFIRIGFFMPVRMNKDYSLKIAGSSDVIILICILVYVQLQMKKVCESI